MFNTWWGGWILGWHKLEQEVSWSKPFTGLTRRLLTAIGGILPKAHCQLSRVIFHAITHKENWVGSIALGVLSHRAHSCAHQDRSTWAGISSPTCNWTSPKSDWAAPVTLTLKKSENVQHMMRRMNTWLAQIRTRSQLKQTLHWTHAKIVDSYRRHTAEGTLPVI